MERARAVAERGPPANAARGGRLCVVLGGDSGKYERSRALPGAPRPDERARLQRAVELGAKTHRTIPFPFSNPYGCPEPVLAIHRSFVTGRLYEMTMCSVVLLQGIAPAVYNSLVKAVRSKLDSAGFQNVSITGPGLAFLNPAAAGFRRQLASEGEKTAFQSRGEVPPVTRLHNLPRHARAKQTQGKLTPRIAHLI